MNKVIDILEKEIEFECMGCDIANHKLIPPGGYVYEDDFINVSAYTEIPITGFKILSTNKHIKSLTEMSEIERINIMKILNKTISAIKKANIAKEVLLIQQEKSNHFHIWIVPIHNWMSKFGKDVKNIKEIIDYSKQNFNYSEKKKLLQAIEDIKIAFNE